MSPSRRRAIGAVRCLASRAPRPCPVTDSPLHTRITRAARWGHRALPPLHPRQSHAMPAPRAATRCAILHYTREIPALHCPWGLPTPGGAMSAAGPPGSRPTAITPATIARYAHARAPLPCAHAASRCRVLGHNDHSNSRFCLKVRKRLGRSLTFVFGIAAHGNHAKKILPLSDSFAKRHHHHHLPKSET